MFYIGSSKHIDKRFKRHRYLLSVGQHQNVVMQRLYDKYGESSFTFEKIIDVPNIEDLLRVEQECLDSMKPTINIGREASGGDNLTKHPQKDDIVRRRTATILAKNSAMTPKEREERFSKYGPSNNNWRGGVSQKFCSCGEKMGRSAMKCMKCHDRSGERNPFYGKKHSKETLKKLTETKIKRHAAMTEEEKFLRNSTMKIVVIDGKEFYGLGPAAKFLGVTIAAVNYRIKSKNFPNTYYLERSKVQTPPETAKTSTQP